MKLQITSEMEKGITFKGDKKSFFEFLEKMKNIAENNKAITLREAIALDLR